MSGIEDRATGPFDLPQEPTLNDLLRVWARQVALGIRTHVPASVLAFDPATGTATVQVGFLAAVKVTDPTKIPAPLLALKGVPPNAEAILPPLQLKLIPVAIYGTDTNYASVPILPGTTGYLEVFDRSLEKWMLTGTPDDPVLAFLHSLKDSVFVPALRPKSKPLALPVDLTATVLEGAQVKIGRDATLSIALAEPLVTALDAFANAVPVSMDGGAAIHTAFKTAWNTAKPLVTATKGKAK